MNARLSLRDRLGLPADPRVIDLRDGHEQDLWVYPEPSPVRDEQLREVKFFGTPAFRRLWFAQLASSLGDWIGIVAITAIASRIGGEGAAALGGVSLVLAARLVPGFFLSPFAGVLVDRWDRKHVMVVTGVLRAAVLCFLPLVDDLYGLIIASLVLELATLLWSTAKEASVPNLVKRDYLATANSLSLAAAYGPLLVAGGLYALFVKVPDWVGITTLSDEALALFFNAFMYVVSAVIIFTLHLPHSKREPNPEAADLSRTQAGVAEARAGFAYIAGNVRVRTVILGLATGLIGGGMVVPLGSEFASGVLNAGSAGYGLLLNGLGMGVALGVLLVNVVQKYLPREPTFVAAVFGAGISLFLTAAMDSLTLAVVFVTIMGVCAGFLYVLGYSSVQVNTSDDMRGRVFATLYASTRVCILSALFVAPLLAVAFGKMSESLFGGEVSLFGAEFELSGVRLTLWLGSVVIVVAAFLATFSLRRGLAASRD